MLMYRPQTPQPGFSSITLLQKFTPHFKILYPRLGLVEMCEVVGMELYWKLIAKMVGLVCEVVTGFLRGCFYWMLVIESNSVNSGTEVLIENVCIK